MPRRSRSLAIALGCFFAGLFVISSLATGLAKGPPAAAPKPPDLAAGKSAAEERTVSHDGGDEQSDKPAPAITTVTPTTGIPDKPVKVRLDGSGFKSAEKVEVRYGLLGDENECQWADVLNDKQLTCIIEAKKAQVGVPQHFIVKIGRSASQVSDAAYTSSDKPVIYSIDHTSLTLSGGIRVELTGANFGYAASDLNQNAVTLTAKRNKLPVTCQDPAWESPTQISCRVPPIFCTNDHLSVKVAVAGQTSDEWNEIGIYESSVSCPVAKPRPQLPERWRMSSTQSDWPRGLSDLTITSNGQLWTVAERCNPELIRLSPWSGATIARIPIAGIGSKGNEEELEALAAVDDKTFLIGTEGQKDDRSGDYVYAVSIASGNARIIGKYKIDYSRWSPLHIKGNYGIESLCLANNQVIAGPLLTLQSSEQWKAIAVASKSHLDTWIALRVKMPDDVHGNISAMACTPNDHGTLVHALVRQHGEAHIVDFNVPDAVTDTTQILDAHAVAELPQPPRGELPNLEGIALSGDSLLLLNDNDDHKSCRAAVEDTLLYATPWPPPK